MQAITALEVKRVPHSEDLLHPGEYVFIGKRLPKVTLEKLSAEEPHDKPDGTLIGNAFRYLKWKLFSKQNGYKEIIEPVWPDYDAVVLMCPTLQPAHRHDERPQDYKPRSAHN